VGTGDGCSVDSTTEGLSVGVIVVTVGCLALPHETIKESNKIIPVFCNVRIIHYPRNDLAG
jgi:hypothetical protein